MWKYLAFVFLLAVGSLTAQVSSSGVQYVSVAPSGACRAGAKIQQVVTGAGGTYTCQSISGGNGTWTVLSSSSASGTVTSATIAGTSGQLNVAGTCTITTTGTCTISIPSSFYTNASFFPFQSITTTGTSGAATLSAGVLNIPNYTYTLPAATSSALGGVKPDGTTLSNTSGAISVNYTSTTYFPFQSITTTGTSGAATLSGGVLNIPQYPGSGLSGMTATQIPVAATASTITSSIATTNPTYFPFQSLTTTGSNCAGATLFTGALNIPPCTGGGSLPSGSLGFTTSNSNGGTTYAASGSNGIDCSQMSGTNLDDQLNNCNAYAITTGVGVMNARYMGNPANFITKEVEKGELVQPTVAAATGTSPGAGTYFVSYVLNSPMVSPSSASKENAVTVTGSQEIQVTSPTYAGTATTYSVYATPTGVAGTGTVSTAGTSAVTWVSGTQFTTGSAWNGQAININGATFTISSVGSATSLTLTGSSTPTGTFPYFTGMWTEKLCSGATNVAIGTNVNLTAACSGSAINTNNHPWGVALWQPYSGSWQIAASANLGTDPITGNGNCAIKNFDQSADDQNQFAIGEGVTFVVTSAGSATYASGWCDDDNPKAGSSYIKHHGEAFTAVASDTITRAGIEYRHLFDSSELDNATTVMAGNAGGPGVWIWGVCCQTSGRHIHVESNGAANNGIVLGNDSVGSSHGGVSNISFYDLVSVHAAVPYSEFVAGSPILLGTTVHGLYMEGPASVTCSQNIISITPNQSASGPFEIDNASMGGNCSTATGVFANVAHTLQQFRMRNVSSGNFLSVLNYAPDTTKNYSIASAGQVVGDIGFNTQSRPDQLTYLNATDWLETPEIVDSNTNEILGFTTTTSAVDYANITNGATGSPGTVTIAAKGTDSNINLNLVSKGSGTVECNGTSCGLPSGTKFNPAINQDGSTTYATSPAEWFSDVSTATDFSLKTQAAITAQNSFNASGGEVNSRGYGAATTASASLWPSATYQAAILDLPAGIISTGVPQVVPTNAVIEYSGHQKLRGVNGQGTTGVASTMLQAKSGTFPAGASGESGTASALATAGTGQSLTITGATPFTAANVGCIVEAPSGAGSGLATNSSWGMISAATSSSVAALYYVNKNGTGNSAGSTWDMICPDLATDTGNLPNAVYGIGAEDMVFDAGNITGAIPFMDVDAQELSYVLRSSFSGFSDVGLYIGAQNSGPYSQMNFCPGSSGNANTVPLVSRVAGGSVREVEGVTITKCSSSTKPAIGIDAESLGQVFRDVHFEDTTTAGLCFGCAPTLNISVPEQNLNAHGSTAIGITGGGASGAGSIVKIGASQHDISLIDIMASSSGFTNTVSDTTAGNTLTYTNNPFVGFYFLDYAGGVFSNANIADSGLSGIFAYNNNLNFLNSGASKASINGSTGAVSFAGQIIATEPSGSVWGSATGGAKGAGTINAQNLYVNGTAVGTGGGPGTGTQYTHPYWSTTSALGSVAPTTGYDGVPQVETNSTTSNVFTAAPVSAPMGVVPNAQTGTTYTYLLTDRAKYVSFSNASSIAVTLPQAGSSGFGVNFVNVSCDIGAGTATITPTTSTISYSTGSAYTSAASTMALTTGQCAWIYSDNTNYFAIKFSGGSGGDTITSPNSTLAIGGTATNTTLDLEGSAGEIMAGATPALTYTPTLGKSGTAGTLAMFPASGNFTTTLGSSATASNTFVFPATVFTTGHLGYCATSSTTCTWTDAGYSYNALPLADHATQTANTLVANVTGSTAAPTAAAIPAGVQFYTAGTGYSAATAAQLGTVLNIASGLLIYSGGTAAAPLGSTDWSASATTLTSAAAGTLNMSASTGAPSVQLPAVVGGTILAGTSTANLSAPVVIQNTNSSNNNTSITMGVSSPGTSTGQTTLNVNCATTQGNCLEAGTGGTWTAGVLSGQTKVFQVLPTGQTTLGTGPTVAGSPTSAFIIGTTGTCPTAQASAGFLCPSSSSDNTYYWNVNNASVNQHLPQTAITSGSAYTNATTGFTSVAGGSGQTLAFTVAASTNYVVTCNILWQGSAGTTGPKFQWTGPASPTAVTASMHSPVTTATYLDATATAFSSPMADTGTITTATNFNAVVTLGLVNGTTGGTVTLQAAANGTGTLTIQPGSFCEFQ